MSAVAASTSDSGPSSQPPASSPVPQRFTLSRDQRLSRTKHFQEAYAQSRKTIGSTMVMWLRDGDDASCRLGVVASKRVGKAHDRNLAKRRLREVFRLNRHRLTTHMDVVLIARKSILNRSADDVQRDFEAVCRRAGILQEAS